MASLILRELWSVRNIIAFLLVPVLLLPILIVIGNSESRCAYVMLLMAVYWTLEIIPVAITGLIPIVLFPVLGILPVGEIAPLYVAKWTFIFVCGLMAACAVQHWNLHKRIALRMILMFGATPRRLMLGMMLPTWFLSLWISNTATTAMMTPIASAIIDQLNELNAKANSSNRKASHLADYSENDVGITEISMHDGRHEEDTHGVNYIAVPSSDRKPEKETYRRINKALTLSIAYSANIGGMGSLIGTSTNMVLLEISDKLYERIGEENPINFASWFTFAFPVSIIATYG